MIKIERTPPPPESLAKEAEKANGNYREIDVVRQLRHDFHNKCYICELDDLTDPEIEHLRPHYGRKLKDRVFDWNNLFYSCRHCNSIKNNKKYDEKILDCCKEDPEEVLNHIFKEGHVIIQSHIYDEVRDDVKMTADLIQNCFEKSNTGIREAGCQARIRKLSETMNALYKILEKFQKGQASGIEKKALKKMLSREYKFAAFTRYYVKTHLSLFPKVQQYLNI